MNAKNVNGAHPNENSNFDLFRLGRCKAVVDLSVNTLRSYNKCGLRFYKVGKAIFVSKAELAAFIRLRSESGLRGGASGVKSPAPADLQETKN